MAQEYDLPLHQLDGFKGWTPPNSPDLIVTVSFGLLVPGRIIDAATYGGLNVHPSLLPDLRGPAPIQRALLERKKSTGVSLQTMHPTQFDHGTVLAQTPFPGLPIPDNATPQTLLDILGPLGAEMLTGAIEDGNFIPPLKDILQGVSPPVHLTHAPKITPEDRHLQDSWDAAEIQLRDRVLGRLWTNLRATHTHIGGWTDHSDREVVHKQGPRVVFTGPWRTYPNVWDGNYENLIAPRPDAVCEDIEPPYRRHFDMDKTSGRLVKTEDSEGMLFVFRDPNTGTEEVRFVTRDGVFVAPTAATIDGGKKDKGLATLAKQVKDARKEHKADVARFGKESEARKELKARRRGEEDGGRASGD